MRIIKITYQYRRDFRADFECEGCGHVERNLSGYDDQFFHDNIIPGKFKCSKCEKTRNDLNIVGRQWQTKYPEGYQV